MKLISYRTAEGSSVGAVHPTRHELFLDIAELAPALPRAMIELLAQGEQALLALRRAMKQALPNGGLKWQNVSDVHLLPVVPRPGKIVCVGLNYADHAKEGGNARPDYPSFFLRGATSLIAHGQPMILPRVSDKLDFEAELALVIGSTLRHADKTRARAAIAGYSCFNDGTLRDYQRKTAQWTIGKTFDGTGGFGPWLVTADELPPGATGLEVVSRLDGQLMQHGNTRDMLWLPCELVMLLSECMTLEPGDVVATGTPAGVGYARTPPVFMQAGSRIEVEITGLGCLHNLIAAESPV